MRCAQDVEEVIRTTTSGRIAGFIAEPIQGVGGFITPPKEYFQIVEKIVRNHGGIFIRRGADRLGTHRRQVVRHRAVGRDAGHHHQRQGPGQRQPHRSHRGDARRWPTLQGADPIATFGGNPVTATAAKAVIDFIEEQKLLDNCTETGGYLRGSLEELKEKHEIIGDVRGMGLMQAIELVEDRKTKTPASAADRAVAGSHARARPAGRQGRALRQRDARDAAHEHRPRRRGPVHPTSGQEPDRRRRRHGGRRQVIPGNLERFPDLHPAFDSQSAVVEANRCLYCFDAPCTAACPTHIDVPRFIKKIATGNLRGSAQTILDANILGLSCSRVCPVDVLCEGSCVLHRYNKQPIEIGRLQRYAMENAKGVVPRAPRR